MDSEAGDARIQHIDPDTAARVVRGILNTETDYFLASGPMSARLIRELGGALQKAAPEPWQVVEADFTASLTAPEWRTTRGVGRGDAWFELSEVVEDENEHSWIAAAVGAGHTQMCLEMKLRRGLTPIATILSAQKDLATKLSKAGFKRADDDKRLVLLLKLDREMLAKAFAENDFADALIPVRKAVEAITAAKTDLDLLVDLVRRKGKPH